jgi:hypothetical protein
MKKYYFYEKESEWCYDRDGIIELMKDCGVCGIDCRYYKPRNGKSGSCKHYSKILYNHGKKITIKL